MRRHKFPNNALSVIANMMMIIAIIISSMFISFNQADSKDTRNNKKNSSSSRGMLLGNTAGNIGISSVELELYWHTNNNNNSSKHVTIKNHTTATKTQTKIEQNFYFTQNCNKLEQSSLGNPSNNNNNKNMTMTTNRTLVAKINETIKNLQQSTAGSSTSAGLAAVRHLSCHKHKRASWSSVNHKRIVVKQGGSVSEVKPSSRFTHEAADGGAFGARMLPKFMARQRRQSRGKRFIIFDGGGVLKLVIGTSFPVKLVDRQRSVTLINNLQALYTPPPTPIYWWSFVNTTTFSARHVPAAAADEPLQQDASRAFIYAAIELMLESNGLPGNACLLKAICVHSQQPLDGSSSIFHALLNAILTPANANIDKQYLHAQTAGRYGVDCAQTFNECPKNISWLKGVRILERK